MAGLSISTKDRIDAALGDPQAGKELADRAGGATITVTAPTFTATTGSLPTANGATTFSDASSPTVAELLDAVVELRAKLATLITQLTA